MILRPSSSSPSLVSLRTSGEGISTLFSVSSMSGSFLFGSEERDWEAKTEARVREPGVAVPGRCFHTSLRRRASMSRAEEMMSSTASDQITITRSSRCEMISVGNGIHISLTINAARCSFSAPPRSRMEPRTWILFFKSTAKLVSSGPLRGEGGVDRVVGKEKEDETDSVARAA